MSFMSFSKDKFVYELTQIRKRNNLKYWNDITKEMQNETTEFPIREYIFAFSTSNDFKTVIIFSSVDIRTGRTRDVGKDAVRFVYKWLNKNGVFYRRIQKRNRVEKVFMNLEETLVNACTKDCFTKYKDWGTLSEALSLGSNDNSI